ncbi:histidine phosphatase family protein [Rossellomorea aquimaris]|uniref:histidine phosphatase family protein n=1 Tax=Rossellomorea aquimaris TaxID=189382 RepID=UPI001CD27E72|nr:histidine phosphatase family protein [Rossellomorea aquimaris]MCA1056109.1 histidine phosphatase family protein [Rossellomorea aquimaris]
MKIGLIRHFKVKRGYPNSIVSSAELMKWVDEYEASEVEENEVDLNGVEWKSCYSSSMRRAEVTARSVYNRDIIFLDELREIPLSPLFPSRMKLPLFIHLTAIRLAWWFNHPSQAVSKKEVFEKINKVIDRVMSEDQDVLIVGHGGVMMFMRKELIRRGFSGRSFRRPENGVVYVYENKEG